MSSTYLRSKLINSIVLDQKPSINSLSSSYLRGILGNYVLSRSSYYYIRGFRIRFQGHRAKGSYIQLFLAKSVGSESTLVQIGYMSLYSSFLYILISSYTLLYKVIINVYIFSVSYSQLSPKGLVIVGDSIQICLYLVNWIYSLSYNVSASRKLSTLY